MNSTGTGAVFREWSNLACLVTTALIYPILLVRAMASPSPYALAALLVIGIGVQVIVLILVHIAAAVLTRREPDDERVRAIEHRAARLGGGVLSVGVFGVIGLTLLQATMLGREGGFAASPLLTGYVLFGVVFLAEVFRMAIVAVGYRTA